MLEYEPQQLHFVIDLQSQPMMKSEEILSMKVEETSLHQQQIFMILRDERKESASERASYVRYSHTKRIRKQRLFQIEDLVSVRNHVVDNQRERKLESRWLSSRLLVGLTIFENSGHVQKLHEDDSIKRYHLNDMLLYKKRGNFRKKGIIFEQSSRGTHSMIINERESEHSESRAVLLSRYRS